jgi:hypothetical protein
MFQILAEIFGRIPVMSAWANTEPQVTGAKSLSPQVVWNGPLMLENQLVALQDK